jgi:hypothetical protein
LIEAGFANSDERLITRNKLSVAGQIGGALFLLAACPRIAIENVGVECEVPISSTSIARKFIGAEFASDGTTLAALA